MRGSAMQPKATMCPICHSEQITDDEQWCFTCGESLTYFEKLLLLKLEIIAMYMAGV
jgi:hypothetical protein